MQQPQQPPAEKQPKTNPLPKQEAGYKKMREEYECPVHQKTLAINGMLQNMRDLIKSGSITLEMASVAQHASLAEDICFDNKKERVVADLNADDLIKSIHTKTLALQREVQDLHQQLVDKSNELETTMIDRWDRTVKTYGLDPDKYHYLIDDDEGKVYQAELDCAKCTSNVKLTEVLESFEKKKTSEPA